MDGSSAQRRDDGGSARRYWNGVARGAGGAIIFALPMLMTMELWWLGFYAGRLRLVLLLALAIPLLVGLSHYSGLRDTTGRIGDAADALSAYGIGFVTSAVVLYVFGVVTFGEDARDIVGKIALEAVPAAIGAVLAQSQMGKQSSGAGEKEQRKRDAGYWGQLFLMACGAVYLGLSVAPTKEMVLIAYKMDAGRAVALAVLSLLLLHAFVYALQFSGEEEAPPGTPWWSLFLRYSIVGYAIALLLSAYILWTFGRFAGMSASWIVIECVVLGFPAAVGAAAARLLL